MAIKPQTIFFLLLSAVQVFGQSNYASHGNNINYIGNGLPEETVLDGKVSDIDFSRESRVGDSLLPLKRDILHFHLVSFFGESISHANCHARPQITSLAINLKTN